MSVRGKSKVFRFSDEQYTSMSGYFTKYEQDGDGELNFNELRNLVREVGHYQDGTDLDTNTKTLMTKLDGSGNSSLSFNEFLKGYEKMLASASNDEESLASLDILHVAIPEKKPSSDKSAVNKAAADKAAADKAAADKAAADKVAADKAAADKVAADKAAADKAAADKAAADKAAADKAAADKAAADKAAADKAAADKAAADKAAADKAAADKVAADKAAADKAAADKVAANKAAADKVAADKAAANKKGGLTLEWPYGGNQVLVGGTFNNWELVPMKHVEGGLWRYQVENAQEGKEYLFKFHVDGQWKEDGNKSTDDNERIDGFPVVNNQITA